MSSPYDATMKTLMEASPTDWPRFLGLPVTAATIVDANVAITSGASDKVLKVTDPTPFIFHIEFQSGNDKTIPQRVLMYNALLAWRHELPVHSTLILLRPEANMSHVQGQHQQIVPGRTNPYMDFRYDVVKIWELDPERLLTGGIGLAALAPISNVRREDIPQVMRRVHERFQGIPSDNERNDMWYATQVLLELRYEAVFIQALLNEVKSMRESVIYQLAVGEGREQAVDDYTIKLHEKILRLGANEYGLPPDAQSQQILSCLLDPDLLMDIIAQIRTVKSWQELLAPFTTDASPSN